MALQHRHSFPFYSRCCSTVSASTCTAVKCAVKRLVAGRRTADATTGERRDAAGKQVARAARKSATSAPTILRRRCNLSGFLMEARDRRRELRGVKCTPAIRSV